MQKILFAEYLKEIVREVDTEKYDFVTDGWPGFFRVLPEEKHFHGKDLTYLIEATHSDLRHRLARFHRQHQKILLWLRLPLIFSIQSFKSFIVVF
jgi:IS1 family transposase